MPNEDRMNWDDVDLPSETITEEDITGAEAMGRVPPGRYLCTCIESNPVSRKAEGYNYIAASLKWRVDKAYEGDFEFAICHFRCRGIGVHGTLYAMTTIING